MLFTIVGRRSSQESVVITIGRQLSLSEFCTSPIMLFVVGHLLGRRSSVTLVRQLYRRHKSSSSVKFVRHYFMETTVRLYLDGYRNIKSINYAISIGRLTYIGRRKNEVERGQ